MALLPVPLKEALHAFVEVALFCCVFWLKKHLKNTENFKIQLTPWKKTFSLKVALLPIPLKEALHAFVKVALLVAVSGQKSI